MSVRAACLLATTFGLAATVTAAPSTPDLAGFTLGASEAQVRSRLGVLSDRVSCKDGPDDIQHCSLRQPAGAPRQRLDVEGVRFSDWTFSFAGNRLVAISASSPAESSAHLNLLSRLTQAFGFPTIRQASSPDRSVTEAHWRLAGGRTLSFHQVERAGAPPGTAALRMLRLSDDARD